MQKSFRATFITCDVGSDIRWNFLPQRERHVIHTLIQEQEENNLTSVQQNQEGISRGIKRRRATPNKNRPKKRGKASLAQKLRRKREKEKNDSIHGVKNSNQAYAPVIKQGTDIIDVSPGPIQPCNIFHQPTVHPLPVSITPSCSKLEIKCEVRDSDEKILPDFGIVKKEPLYPFSDVANEGELLHSNNQSAAECETRGELSLNNTEIEAIKHDPGEVMVISLDPAVILPY